MVEKLEIMPFLIEDEDGSIPVESTAVELDITPFKSGKWKPDDKRVALIALGHPSANAESHVDETMVEVGQSVTVAGKLQKSETEPKLRLVGDADHPIAIAVDRARDRDLSADP
jgi:hypothetical protein